MKNLLMLAICTLFACSSYAQETLQTVTDRGSATTNSLNIGNVLRLQANGEVKSEFAFDNNIQQMYLYGYSPSSFFSVYTAGTRRFDITADGNVGIGTSSPTEKLTVAGNINAREVKVTATAGADFVFEKGYRLPDLKEVEKYISENKHLPEIPSAKEMVEDGVKLGELNIKLLQKIEELTLHLIDQQKQINELRSCLKTKE